MPGGLADGAGGAALGFALGVDVGVLGGLGNGMAGAVGVLVGGADALPLGAADGPSVGDVAGEGTIARASIDARASGPPGSGFSAALRGSELAAGAPVDPSRVAMR